jgi:hypothetical protein
MLLKHRKAFIKVCTLWNKHLFGQGIVELPALVTLRVSNEDTLLHVRSKAPKASLVLLNQDMGSTAPNTQMREIRLVPIECFMWSGSLKRSSGHLIAHMDEGGDGFAPEGGRHADSWSMEMMPSSIVLLATPFCWGLFLTVCCLWMPWSMQNTSNSLDMYSLPLSSHKEPILQPVTFSAHALNAAKVSDLHFKRYTGLKWEKSSMKDTQ